MRGRCSQYRLLEFRVIGFRSLGLHSVHLCAKEQSSCIQPHLSEPDTAARWRNAAMQGSVWLLRTSHILYFSAGTPFPSSYQKTWLRENTLIHIPIRGSSSVVKAMQASKDLRWYRNVNPKASTPYPKPRNPKLQTLYAPLRKVLNSCNQTRISIWAFTIITLITLFTIITMLLEVWMEATTFGALLPRRVLIDFTSLKHFQC